MIYGKRRLRLKENFVFYYPKGKMKARVKIGGKEFVDQLTGGIYLKESLDPVPKEKLEKNLFKHKEKDLKLISQIGGGWTENISFDCKEFWNRKMDCYQWKYEKDVLPSDARFREDCIWLYYGFPD